MMVFPTLVSLEFNTSPLAAGVEGFDALVNFSLSQMALLDVDTGLLIKGALVIL